MLYVHGLKLVPTLHVGVYVLSASRSTLHGRNPTAQNAVRIGSRADQDKATRRMTPRKPMARASRPHFSQSRAAPSVPFSAMTSKQSGDREEISDASKPTFSLKNRLHPLVTRRCRSDEPSTWMFRTRVKSKLI
jgi:hypothetical protein